VTNYDGRSKTVELGMSASKDKLYIFELRGIMYKTPIGKCCPSRCLPLSRNSSASIRRYSGIMHAEQETRREHLLELQMLVLRANGVLRPSAAVLERIGLAARARARKRTFETLAAGMSDAERDTLARLLTVDPELRRSRFAWLRDYSESPAPSNTCWGFGELSMALPARDRRCAEWS
jgi:hypothetical protein